MILNIFGSILVFIQIHQIFSMPFVEYYPYSNSGLGLCELGGYGQSYGQGRSIDQGYLQRSNQANGQCPVNLNIYTGCGESESPNKYIIPPMLPLCPHPPAPVIPPLSPSPPPSIPLPSQSHSPTPSRSYNDTRRSKLFTSLFSIPGAIADSILSGDVTI